MKNQEHLSPALTSAFDALREQASKNYKGITQDLNTPEKFEGGKKWSIAQGLLFLSGMLLLDIGLHWLFYWLGW